MPRYAHAQEVAKTNFFPQTHQNNFHKDVLDDLTAKFIQFTNEGYVPEEYRTLFDYFKLHYKNSNKGIKGRGKARKIAGGDAQSPRKANTPSAPSSRRTLDHSAYTVSHGSGATSAPSMAESVPRSNGGYGTAAGFPVQHAGAAPPMFYDDHHGRHLAFPEQRFY